MSEAYEEPKQDLNSAEEPSSTTSNASKEHGAAVADSLRLAKTKSIGEQLSPARQVLFVAIVCLAQFWTQFALSMILATLHVVGGSFGISNPGVLSWLIAGYSLTVGTFILVSGRFGDVFGYKLMYLIGFSWMALWSLICGVSVYSNKVLFIFARALQGIGPSIVLPNGLALLGAAYPPGRKKAMAFSVFAASAPTGSIFGLSLWGVFALAWWPWTFFAFTLMLIGTVVTAYFVIPDEIQRIPPRVSLHDTMASLDIVGALIGVTALIVFNFAWNQAPVVGWQEPYVYVTLIVGVVLVGVFFYYEDRIAHEPLLPIDKFSGDVGIILACIACGWSSFGIWFFYTVQYLELIRGTSPLLTAAWMSPVAVSGACAAFTTGQILHRIKPAWVILIALLALTIGTVLIMTTPVHQTYWAQIFVSMVIMPWGMDMSFPAATLLVSNSVPKNQQGIAASLVNTVVNYSISIGLGLAGTIEVHVNHGGQTPTQQLQGFRGALYMGAGLAGLGVAISLFFVAKSYTKDRKDRRSEE